MLRRTARRCLSAIVFLGIFAAQAQQPAAPQLTLGPKLAREFARPETASVEITELPAQQVPSALSQVESRRCDSTPGGCAVKAALKVVETVPGVPLSERQRSYRCAGINTPDDCHRMR